MRTAAPTATAPATALTPADQTITAKPTTASPAASTISTGDGTSVRQEGGTWTPGVAGRAV